MSFPRLQYLVLAAAAVAGLASASSVSAGLDDTEYARLQGLGEVSYDTAVGALAGNGTCNVDNVVVRRSCEPHNDTGVLSWNPRCLKRDLTDYIIQNFNSATQVLDTILLWDTISDFQLSLQGINITTGANYLGPHGGGHWSMGGDPGRDLFASPAYPAFYLHHTMLDRVWWMWQMQSPAERISGPTAVRGTITFLKSPPSRNASLDDYNEKRVRCWAAEADWRTGQYYGWAFLLRLPVMLKLCANGSHWYCTGVS
ncbi:hypothetical protein F5883DRAFT_647196 [Diaporthe sp. PMI_573]|nr:hypothetical protein F5883DRAFT_647196 [Diaporthaceae sp. PMI_573]